MATDEGKNIFAAIATSVDDFFARKYYRIGLFVGTRPCTSLLLSLIFMLACVGGFSQFNSESRADKLWIPQGTRAQDDEAAFTKYFPPGSRFMNILVEAKTGSILDKSVLLEAVKLHEQIEEASFEGTSLRDICIPQPGSGHPCFISSVLGLWAYNSSTLQADMDPLATLNKAGMTSEDLSRMLGSPSFADGGIAGAKSMSITYLMKLDRKLDGGSYTDPVGEGFEEEILKKVLACDKPTCSGNSCACGYESSSISVYAATTRSFGDVFGGVISGDVGLVNGAFMLMILYLILNLGGLCHKVNSRAGLAFLCVLTIVAAGAGGYGLGMWSQFDYTPVHSVLPFVIIGIGVDDSFVIMNALDRTDASLPPNERIAQALSHAGVSIMVTSVTDFVAFAISVSSALPALSSFCMYAAFCILLLFIFQVTMFSAFAALDLRRVVSNRIDCCFCLPRGFICCPVVPKEEAARAIEEGKKDPNQMLCCSQPRHTGGRIGLVLEKVAAPQLVKKPVAAVLIALFSGWCGICAWQAASLDVQDTQRKFLPDDSYLLTTLEKNDEYFSDVGIKMDVMTVAGDYFGSQRALVGIGAELETVKYVLPTSSDAYRNWAAAFKDACGSGAVKLAMDADGYATNQAEYYEKLMEFSKTSGARYAGDIVWVNEADPQQGIAATKIAAELRSVKKTVGGQTTPDADSAVEAMDSIRKLCDAQTGLPGGKCVPYTADFLTWETFKIIKQEMFLSTGLCLVAVLVITMVLIAHPLTSILVFICVVMTIVDILGCMHMWGLAIDSVSVIQLVIAVGLSVDYAAHVGHNFMLQTGTREERVVATLGDVGAAVLCGAISTFLGVMLLVLSKSYVFRVLFQTFFLTVVFGLAHGLLLLPALLSLIGPASYKGSSKAKVGEPAA